MYFAFFELQAAYTNCKGASKAWLTTHKRPFGGIGEGMFRTVPRGRPSGSAPRATVLR